MLSALSEDIQWISKTWGGPAGLAGSGCAWAAFMDAKVASIACPFYFGDRYEDIGIVTEPAFRGKGLAIACTSALIKDIFAKGHLPSWGTSPDNEPSLRIARKLGFQLQREDVLYVISSPVPKSAIRLES
jgi:RimJ/RimL family protein N-acetyltransferase